MYSSEIVEKSPWDKLNIARDKNRPNARFYIENIFNDFIELHGDRYYKDDSAIIGGIASVNNINVTVIGINKGKDTGENIKNNFGMPHPEGYRKALRLMKQAEKFNRPIICFVDTPGAFCGIEAEERGQGEAIAQNLLVMSKLKTPIISIIIGEGGSGGALALAVANKVYMLENSVYSILSPEGFASILWKDATRAKIIGEGGSGGALALAVANKVYMLENSVYSILSPEGFASILWKDATRAKEASEVMKITAKDLKGFNIIDNIIEEPVGGAHEDPKFMCDKIKENILNDLEKLINTDLNEVVDMRYNKFRKIGNFY